MFYFISLFSPIARIHSSTNHRRGYRDEKNKSSTIFNYSIDWYVTSKCMWHV
ncbi:hypothetical protein GCM10008924_10520 [Gracilibacillus halotolerans]